MHAPVNSIFNILQSHSKVGSNSLQPRKVCLMRNEANCHIKHERTAPFLKQIADKSVEKRGCIGPRCERDHTILWPHDTMFQPNSFHTDVVMFCASANTTKTASSIDLYMRCI